MQLNDNAIGSYARIICVYTSVYVSGKEWMHHDGCGRSAYPGKAFIFDEQSRKEGLLSIIHDILNDCWVDNVNIIGPVTPA